MVTAIGVDDRPGVILVFQKLLRTLCILTTAFALAFVLSHGVRRTEWFKERLYRQLMTGDADARLQAAGILADVGAERQLLRGLKSRNATVSDAARRALDHIWFHAAGGRAYAEMEKAYGLAEAKKFAEAIAILDGVLGQYPDYAEALNRRAAALWQVGEYEKSRRDCERAVAINPNHYGAWQGLGVSQLQLGDFAGARRALLNSLEIAPNDQIAQRCLKKVDDFLRQLSGGAPGKSNPDTGAREPDLL